MDWDSDKAPDAQYFSHLQRNIPLSAQFVYELELIRSVEKCIIIVTALILGQQQHAVIGLRGDHAAEKASQCLIGE